jgi:hypothetical protein
MLLDRVSQSLTLHTACRQQVCYSNTRCSRKNEEFECNCSGLLGYDAMSLGSRIPTF